MNKIKRQVGMLAGLVVLTPIGLAVLSSQANAQIPTWDPTATNVDYTNPAQVSNANLFVDSFTFAPTDTTVNGITFNAVNSTSNLDNITFDNGSKVVVNLGSSPTVIGVPISNGGSTVNSYAVAIGNAACTSTPVGASIQFNGLTSGDTYDIQLWVAPWDSALKTTFSSTSGDFTAGDSGVSPVLNAVGGGVSNGNFISQFINGSFVANGTTETVYYSSPSFSTLAAGDITEVTQVSAVPEPSTYALMILGGALLLIRRVVGRRSVGI